MLRTTLVSLVVAASLVACSDNANMVAPHTVSQTGGRAARSTLYCTATVHPQMVTCTPVGGAASAEAAARGIRRNVIVGKQNVYVYFATSGYAFNSGTNVFSFNATVQNLMTQPIGTQNGTTVAGGGVDVFFTNGPFVACGSGTVSAVGTSTGTFTASGQQYYAYNQIIKSDSVSALKQWNFQLSTNVCGFNFFVEVSADMPAEGSVLRWTPIHQGVTGNQLTAVWQDSTDDVFAVGLNGTVLHYNGTTWSALPLNQPTYQLRAVYGTSSSDVWMVGDGGVTVHYNGSTFTTVSTGLATPPNLKGVWEANSKNIYAVGGAITVLQSRNATSWTAVATPHGVVDTLRAVWGADSAHVFAVGDAGRLLMYNGTGSTGWTAFAKPTGNPPFRGVWGTSATNVFAVATNGAVYQYNGATWTVMNSNTTNELDAVGGTSASNVWAVGVDGTTIHFNGAGNWTYINPSVGLNLHGVSSGSASPTWAVGDGGTLISLSGTTETVSAQSGFPIFRIWAASDTSIWATTVGTVLHSNNGTTWSTMYVSTTPNDTMLGLWGFNPADVHTLSVNGNVANYNGSSWTATVHGGTSWRAEYGNASDTLQLCAASQAGAVYCNNIGSTTVQAGTAQLFGLWGATNGTLYTTNVNGGIYQSTDSGRTFNAMTSGTTDSLFAIWGSGPTAIWAAGQAGTMLFNSGGATWTAQASGTTNDLRWMWADTPPTGYTGDVYAVGDAGTIQHWNGTQWSPMWSGVTTTLRAVYGLSPTQVYIVGDNGLVLAGSQ
ncbi:MAG TPA: hypothetical protein VK807_06645 [Gemmatimonadaceae bacterium]|nr:hypothetical protein [Gemmatimonadaceae bacterium]